MKKNRILFLTGSNGQLGGSIINCFSKKNWKIFGLDIQENTSNKEVFSYVSGSVSKRESFEELFAQAEKEIKSNSDLCLVNNAGVAVFSPSEERTYEEFKQVSEVNLLGPIFGCTEFYKFLKKKKKYLSGDSKLQIINIASIYGIISPNKTIYTDTARTSSEIYGATKAGLIQMTKYFATRYADFGMRVNCIAPGGVLNNSLQGPEFIKNYSNLVPLKRLCNDNEVSALIYSLVTGDFNYVTGQTIAIDGGMTSW